MKNWKLTGIVKALLAGLFAGLATLLGGWDDAMLILTIFITLDIVAGWVRAFVQKKLSSNESFRGTAKKLLIYAIVVIAAQMDRLAGTTIVRNATITYYCATEALSIVENVVAAGVPVPSFISDALKKLNSKKFDE